MRNADALRSQRRAVSNSMQFIAITGIFVTLLVVAIAMYQIT